MSGGACRVLGLSVSWLELESSGLRNFQGYAGYARALLCAELVGVIVAFAPRYGYAIVP